MSHIVPCACQWLDYLLLAWLCLLLWMVLPVAMLSCHDGMRQGTRDALVVVGVVVRGSRAGKRLYNYTAI